jgi:hypothetical protein
MQRCCEDADAEKADVPAAFPAADSIDNSRFSNTPHALIQATSSSR